MNRRQLLKAGGVSTLVVLAGCTSQQSDREQRPADSGGNGGGNGGSGGNGNSQSENSDNNPVELLNHEFYNNGTYDAGVTGQVENVSGEELTYVSVEVFFLDSEGVQFAEGLDNTSDLAAGRIWEFEAMLLAEDAGRVNTYEIQTDVTDF